MSINFVLMDIEGTTSSISFVHKVLFPYALERMESFILGNLNDDSVKEDLKEVAKTLAAEGSEISSTDSQIKALCDWIREDRKHPALKSLQGKIWKKGFESGEIKGHIYEEVPSSLKIWKDKGLGLGIYSSGSVQAQKLLFAHLEVGDLTPLLSAYFDTNIGHKREVESYRNISTELNLPADEILFLSDIKEELDAAEKAGFQTIQLLRPNDRSSVGHHRTAESFSDISL